MTDIGTDADVIQLRPDTLPPTDPAPVAPLAEEPGTRHPVVPGHLRRGNLRATVEQFLGLQAYRTAYHGVRLPGYAFMTCWYALKGAGKVGATLGAWLHVPNLWILESQAVVAGRSGHNDAMNAHVRREKTQAERRGRLAAALAALGVVAVITIHYLPAWAWPLLGLVSVILLARHGKPAGKPLVRQAVVPARYQELTIDIVYAALARIGITPLTKAVEAGTEMRKTPIHKDGPGWAVRLELPEGVTAVEVIDQREKFAANLRRPLSAVWPLPVSAAHPGMLDLWVGYTALNEQPPVKWPLGDAGKADLFQPLPFGADQRGNIVTIMLMFASMLIGAMPRMGKTFALRVLMLACALDPNARLRVWELKGTGDLAAAKHVAHEYGSGANRQTLEACLASVRAYHGQLDTRAQTLSDIAERSPELVPENKVTPELCARRSLGLFPDVLIIDEIQEAFGDKELGGQFEDLLIPITKRGPALGMSLILATQRPDKKSLPTGISANIGIRFCLKVMGYVSSNMVLGDGMSTAGFNAADFARSDKGIGWLTGEADDPQIVRGCYIDAPGAEKIALRARAARMAAGTLSGYAAGVDSAEEPRDVLADVLAVFGTDTGLHWQVLAERLAEAFPDRWAGITKDAISAQMSGLGVQSVQVKVDGRNLKGCRRLDAEQAGGVR